MSGSITSTLSTVVPALLNQRAESAGCARAVRTLLRERDRERELEVWRSDLLESPKYC